MLSAIVIVLRRVLIQNVPFYWLGNLIDTVKDGKYINSRTTYPEGHHTKLHNVGIKIRVTKAFTGCGEIVRSESREFVRLV